MTQFARSISCVLSGGQTGVDRAALDAALDLGVLCSGCVPLDRQAEDAAVDTRYPLIELEDEIPQGYMIRTVRNIYAADLTLILTRGVVEGGTLLTAKECRAQNRRYKITRTTDLCVTEKIVEKIDAQRETVVLNVAGPRQSKRPGIYAEAYAILHGVFRQIARRSI